MPRTRSIAWSQLKVGIIGIIAIGLAAVLIVAVGGQGGFFWQRFPLQAKFEKVDGLKTGAVVRLNGVEVGQVTGVEFAGPEILVSIEISKDVRALLTTDSVASIGSLSLLGETIIDLTASRTGDPLADGAFIAVSLTGGPFGALTSTASKSLDQAGLMIEDMRAGRGTLGKLVTDEALYTQLSQLVKTADVFAKQLANGKGTIGKLVNDPAAYQSLVKSLENLATTTEKITSGRGTLGRLINDDTLERSLAATAASLDQITARLNKGEGTMGKLLTDRQLYDRLSDTIARLDQVVTGVQGGRGTMGQLLQDQALYDNLNKTVVEMRSLLADIRKDPKKYLNVKVSIF